MMIIAAEIRLRLEGPVAFALRRRIWAHIRGGLTICAKDL